MTRNMHGLELVFAVVMAQRLIKSMDSAEEGLSEWWRERRLPPRWTSTAPVRTVRPASTIRRVVRFVVLRCCLRNTASLYLSVSVALLVGVCCVDWIAKRLDPPPYRPPLDCYFSPKPANVECPTSSTALDALNQSAGPTR